MIGDLRGKTIIITGASSGIGAATAIAAAEAGMKVVAVARRADRLDLLTQRIRSLGSDALPVAVDITSPSATTAILDAATNRFGGFDAVFANAGFGIDLPVHETADLDLRRIFEVNFFASADLIRESARRLISAGRRGHLLMCSSCLAKFTLPSLGAYSATKAAQAHLCRAMRFELRPHNIEVASVHPITTTTEFFAVASGDSGPVSKLPDHAPKMFVQPPERVARAVIKCLRRPRSEVWTSIIVRTVAGFMTVCPPLMDMVISREARRLAAEPAERPAPVSD